MQAFSLLIKNIPNNALYVLIPTKNICVNVPKLEPSIWLLWWVFLKVNHKELKWRHSQD
jgi:hypothetical protein